LGTGEQAVHIISNASVRLYLTYNLNRIDVKDKMIGQIIRDRMYVQTDEGLSVGDIKIERSKSVKNFILRGSHPAPGLGIQTVNKCISTT
jgi:hypothetical protein